MTTGQKRQMRSTGHGCNYGLHSHKFTKTLSNSPLLRMHKTSRGFPWFHSTIERDVSGTRGSFQHFTQAALQTKAVSEAVLLFHFSYHFTPIGDIIAPINHRSNRVAHISSYLYFNISYVQCISSRTALNTWKYFKSFREDCGKIFASLSLFYLIKFY